MSIRGNIARRAAGGPRFRPQPDKLLIEVGDGSSISQLSDEVQSGLGFSSVGEPFSDTPVDTNLMERVQREAKNLGMDTKMLENLGVIVAEADNLESVLNTVISSTNKFSESAISRVQKQIDRAKNTNDTFVGGFRPGILNFSDDKAEFEANIRNVLADISLSNALTDALEELEGVVNAELNYTRATFGPRNLNLDVLSEARTVENDKTEGLTTVADVNEKIGVTDAWDITTGEGAVAAIFDTSFYRGHFNEENIIDSFSGSGVTDAFSAPSEGHGTMTAYSMAGNAESSPLNYSGVAKDADVLLARVSGSDGSLSNVAEAWDWLMGWIKELDRPVISNHSYGVPLCSARAMGNCDTTTTKIARLANNRSDHQAFYAAGNEALYCGHRLSGVTNGINGINSDPTSITSAAFRFDLRDAQNYSSHGFGTCNSRDENPKPDVGCLLPSLVPYGEKQKDMSTGAGGSGGGTSEASPLNAGVATLIASVTGNADREQLESILEETTDRVRPTQVNLVRGHDARFGHGQVNAKDAVERAKKEA